jgi:AcrR family transcriptional regulator
VVDLKRGRPRTFDRTAALETATRLFWTRGYDAVSIADLTSALGISTPSLYAAFGDKRALFFEAVHHFEDAYGISLGSERTARAAVHQLRRNGLRLAITRRLRRAVREGELGPDTDVSGLAGFFAATIQGMSQRARDGASRRELRAVADTAIRAWPG